MSLSVTFISTALVLFGHAIALKLLRIASFPPGPMRWPFVGYLSAPSSHHLWLKYAQWAQEYGVMLYIREAGVPWVILNSLDIAIDLLQTQGDTYSDRSPSHFLGSLIGWKSMTVFLNDGPQLKEHRSLMLRTLGSKASLKQFEPTVTLHTRNFLSQLLKDSQPDHVSVHPHIRKFSRYTILDVTYGYAQQGIHDETIDLAMRTIEDAVVNAPPGARLVDTIAWASYLPSWLPGLGFKEAKQMRTRLVNFVDTLYKFAKDHSNTKVSFVANHAQSQNNAGSQEDNVKWAAAMIFVGGTDTTLATISSFFLYMMQNPDVQLKAQAEIDDNVGSDRLPTLSDRHRLPYLDALISETLRYSVIAPLGASHTAKTDGSYNGYLIPKGSRVTVNAWSISRDPRHHRNPEQFDPSRFLGDNPEKNPREYVFGFGRRICPGRFFADNNVYLAISSVLSTFSISKAVDDRGNIVEPVIEFENPGSRAPKPFPCKIIPRSRQREKLLITKGL